MSNDSKSIRADVESLRASLDAAGYIHGQPSGTEQRLYCPACEDPHTSRSPSGMLNLDTGQYNCLKSDGEHGGSIAKLRRLMTAKGITAAPLSDAAMRAVRNPVPKPRPKPREVDKATRLRVDRAELRLWEEDAVSDDYLRFLTDRRGLSPDTMQEARLGLEFNERDNEWRILIPVIQDGTIINVRRYLVDAPNAANKIISIQGHGAGSFLYGVDDLAAHPELPVFVTEGEFDRLLAQQESDGRYVAVSGTGGAKNVPADIDVLVGREVYIGYDCDEAGREGAAKVSKQLRELGGSASIVDLTSLGLGPDSGEDVTDLLIRHATADDLAEAFETSRQLTERPRFERVTAAELAGDVPPMRWLVRDVWAEGAYGVYGGAKKTLKTYNLLALALAVTSGEPFLGRFAVPTPRPVVMYLAEGGRDSTMRRLQQIAASMGVDLATLPLTLVFDSAPIGSAELTEAITRDCRELRPGLVILDALYAFHAADIEVSNLYARGQMLREIERLVVARDRALILADHFSKLRSKELDLDAISQSGVAEWVQSWALAKHRSNPKVAEGEFRLAVQYGGREGYGNDWAVDWSLGPLGEDGVQTGPVEVRVRSLDEVLALAPEREHVTTDDRITRDLLSLLQDQPFEMGREDAVQAIKGSAKLKREAFSRLEASGVISAQTVQRVGTDGKTRPATVWGAEKTLRLSAVLSPPVEAAEVDPPAEIAAEVLSPPVTSAAIGGSSRRKPRDPSRQNGSTSAGRSRR